MRASAELQNQECLACGGWFWGDSSSSLARRLELSFVFLLKPQPRKWVKWSSASRLQHVHKTGFSYSVYKCCVFLHQDAMGPSILTGMPQLSLERTTNALAPTSKATAFTCGFICMFMVSSESAQLYRRSHELQGWYSHVYQIFHFPHICVLNVSLEKSWGICFLGKFQDRLIRIFLKVFQWSSCLLFSFSAQGYGMTCLQSHSRSVEQTSSQLLQWRYSCVHQDCLMALVKIWKTAGIWRLFHWCSSPSHLATELVFVSMIFQQKSFWLGAWQ